MIKNYMCLIFLFFSTYSYGYAEMISFSNGQSLIVESFEYSQHRYIMMKCSGYNVAQVFHDLDCSCMKISTEE